MKSIASSTYLMSFVLGLSLCFPDTAFAHIVRDSVSAGQSIEFYWTKDNEALREAVWAICIQREGQPEECNPMKGVFGPTIPFPQSAKFRFLSPDIGETDWKQIITLPDGTRQVFSDVLAANIVQSPSTGLFEFQELRQLPSISWRIPDLFPVRSNPLSGIYTAVNLDLYLSRNPLGFNNGNWSVGQTLDQLSVQIIDGMVPGLEGIYWSTTPFNFDPSSPIGFSPTGGSSNFYTSSVGNPILINNEHTAPIPEPSSIFGLMLFGGLGAGMVIRRHKPKLKSYSNAN